MAPIKDFIADTNCIIMRRHGFTVLGRTVSEAYDRTNVLISEAKRNIIAETLAKLNKAGQVDYRRPACRKQAGRRPVQPSSTNVSSRFLRMDGEATITTRNTAAINSDADNGRMTKVE